MRTKLLISAIALSLLGGAFVYIDNKSVQEDDVAIGGAIKESIPTHFAEIDKQGNVLRVIVADQAFIDSGKVGDPVNWVGTWMDGSKRYHYAGKGYKYDKQLDAFIPPKPSENATLRLPDVVWVTPASEVLSTSTATST